MWGISLSLVLSLSPTSLDWKPSFVYIPADSRAANQDGKFPKETSKARFERRATKTLCAHSDIFNQCFSRKHRRPLDLPSRMKSRTNTALISRLDFRCSLGPPCTAISSNRAYSRGWEYKTTISSFFCEVRYSPLISNSWKNRQPMTNCKSWDEFETARILFFRLKFLSLLLLSLLKLSNVTWQGGNESSDKRTRWLKRVYVVVLFYPWFKFYFPLQPCK